MIYIFYISYFYIMSIKEKSTKMIAHRGYSAKAPENSEVAFIMAGYAGFFGVECDIQRSSDGIFVVMHDKSLSRTTNGKGDVSNHTCKELQTYIIGAGKDLNVTQKHLDIMGLSGGFTVNNGKIQISNSVDHKNRSFQVVPTLEEYLSVCKEFKIVPIIELKKELDVKDIEDFLKILDKWSFIDNCIVISFKTVLLEKLRQLNNNVYVQPLLNFNKKNIDYCIKTFGTNCGIDVPCQQIKKELVDYAHKNNITVNVWTVDSYFVCKTLVDIGVDYITTNGIIDPCNEENDKINIEVFKKVKKYYKIC